MRTFVVKWEEVVFDAFSDRSVIASITNPAVAAKSNKPLLS